MLPDQMTQSPTPLPRILVPGLVLLAAAGMAGPSTHLRTIDGDLGPGWEQRWQVVAGGFATHEGGVVSTGPKRNVLALREPLPGDVAVDYTAEILPGTWPCDVSLQWRQDPFPIGPWGDDHPTWYLALGEWDGAASSITQYPREQAVAYAAWTPPSGVPVRVHAEFRGRVVTVAVNQRPLLRHVNDTPFADGHLALYGFYPGKHFRDVTITRLTPLAQPGPDAAAEILAAADRALAAGDHAVALAHLEQALQEGDAATASEVARRWSVTVDRLSREPAPALLERYLALLERHRTALAATTPAAARALLATGRYQELLERYPSQPIACAEALIRLGRAEEVLTRSPDRRLACIRALKAMARYDEIRRDWCAGLDTPDLLSGATEGGDPAAFLRVAPTDPRALYASGKVTEVAEQTYDKRTAALARLALHRTDLPDPALLTPAIRIAALLDQGRLAEALDLGERAPEARLAPRFARGLEAWIAGRQDEAQTWFAVPPGLPPVQEQAAWMRDLIIPLLRQQAGEAGALEAACTAIVAGDRFREEQRPWHRAAYVLGRIDAEAFRAQPHRLFAAAELLLLDALKADAAGQTEAAARGYAAWLDLPRWQREFLPEVVVERFAAWRAGR